MGTVDELNIVLSANTGSTTSDISGVTRAVTELGESADNTKGGLSGFAEAMSGVAQQMMQAAATFQTAAAGFAAIRSAPPDFDALAGSASRASDMLAAVATSSSGIPGNISALGTAAGDTREQFGGLESALVSALKKIEGFSDNMEKAGKDAESAAKNIGDLSKKIGTIKTQPVTDLSAAFSKLSGVVATLGIGKFIKDSNDAFNTQMQNELKLAVVMRQRIKATDDEIQSVKNLASAQQRIGVIGDEIQLAGAQQLATFAGQTNTIQTLIPAMNNLLAQQHGYSTSAGDAISVANLMGKALQGQTSALSRVGISFTEAQEQVLKYGNESQRAAVLAQVITDNVGEMNKALANTPTGRLKQLENDFGDLREVLGATFQPLISAVIPVLRGAMETLAEPILNVSKGIAVIGQAITSIDSPAVRGIALAAAGIAVLGKLKAAIGGPLTLLLTLGVTLAGLIGSAQEQTESIGDIVQNAYKGATEATNDAVSATQDYENELAGVQKAVSRLAGFDTITKLSGGGSTGALVSALIGNDGAGQMQDFADAAANAKNIVDSISPPNFSIDLSQAWKAVTDFGADFWTALFGTDDEQYSALKNLTDKIEKIFGTPFTDFWEGVGANIYDIINGDDSQIYKGWKGLNDRVGELFGSFYVQIVSPYFQQAGQSLQKMVDGIEKASSGDYSGAAEAFAVGATKGLSLTPFISNDLRENLVKTSDYGYVGDWDNANIAWDKAQKEILDGLSGINDIPKNILSGTLDVLQWDMGGSAKSIIDDMAKGWTDFWGGVGAGLHDISLQMVKGTSDDNFAPTVTNNNYSPPLTLAQTGNTGIVPTSVDRNNITIYNYIGDEKINSDKTVYTNGI